MAAYSAEDKEAIREALRDRLATLTFLDFAKRLWSVAVPSAECVWGRHMDVICDEIQAVLEESDRRRLRAGEILRECGRDRRRAEERIGAELGGLPKLRLVLLIPPRHSKSALVSRLLPAFRWLQRPQEQILTLTAAETLIERDGLAVRDVIRSETYRRLQQVCVDEKRLRRVFGLREDQFAKKKFDTTEGGTRQGYPLGAGYTGVDSDITVIDDPHDIDDAMLGSAAMQTARMEEVRETYKDKIQDRLNSPIWGVVILIMQRVHPHDLADYMIGQGAKVVCLPAEYMPEHPHRYAKDWRTEPGEPLNPARFPRQVLADKRAESAHGYATKWQLLPTAKEGGRYQRAWLTRRYREDPHTIAAGADEVLISVDTAKRAGKRNDFTAMHVWARRGARRTLLDRRHVRAEYPEVRRVFRDLCAAWPEAIIKLVENSANGPALKPDCENPTDGSEPIVGIVLVTVTKSKEVRSNVAEGAAEAGLIDLPENASWVGEFVENVCSFGAGGAHDDDVDAMSQAFERWAQHAAPWLGADRRASIDESRPAWAAGEALRWERRLDGGGYWIGMVPGWAQGRPGDEAVAVVVDRRGRMVGMLEATDQGAESFASTLATEAAYWDAAEVRYAEMPGRPTAQIVTALSRQGVRVGGRMGKLPGQPGGGFSGNRAETAALWSGFLASLAEGLVGVRDVTTMGRLETVVEEDGAPRMASGEPIGGRVLALLLALQAAAEARATEVEERKPRITFVREESKATDMWSIAARGGGGR